MRNMSTKSTTRKGKALLQNHDYQHGSCSREEEEEDCEEAEQEAADEEEEANIEEYELD